MREWKRECTRKKKVADNSSLIEGSTSFSGNKPTSYCVSMKERKKIAVGEDIHPSWSQLLSLKAKLPQRA